MCFLPVDFHEDAVVLDTQVDGWVLLESIFVQNDWPILLGSCCAA